MKRPFTMEEKLEILRGWYRPHRLAKDVRGNLYEYISLPYVENDKIMIKVRVPGDPTTMRTAHVWEVSDEGRDCYCAKFGEFYCKKEKAWPLEPVGREG